MAPTNNTCLIILQNLSSDLDRFQRIAPSNAQDAQRHQLVLEFVDESKMAIQEITGSLKTCVQKLGEFEAKLNRFTDEYLKQSVLTSVAQNSQSEPEARSDIQKPESTSSLVHVEENKDICFKSRNSSDLEFNEPEAVRDTKKTSSAALKTTKAKKKKAKKQMQKTRKESVDNLNMCKEISKQSRRTYWKLKLSMYFRLSGTEMCLEEMKATKFSEVLEDAKWFHTTNDYQENFPDTSRQFVIDEIGGRYQDQDRNAFYGAILDLLDDKEFDLRSDELVQFLMVKAKWFQRLLLRENNLKAELNALVNESWKTSVTNYTRTQISWGQSQEPYNSDEEITHYKYIPFFTQRAEYHKKLENKTIYSGIWSAMYDFLESQSIQNEAVNLDFNNLNKCTRDVEEMERTFLLAVFDMKEYVCTLEM